MRPEPTTLQEMHARYVESRRRIFGEPRTAIGFSRRDQAPVQVGMRVISFAEVQMQAREAERRVQEETERLRRARAQERREMGRPIALIRTIAEASGLTLDIVLSKSRIAEVVAVRWDAIVAVSEAFPKHSMVQIGNIFSLDHTTVLHALKKRGAWPRKTGARS